MSDETATKLSTLRKMSYELWKLGLSLRELRKKGAVLRNGAEELVVTAGRYPGIKPELLAELAAAAERVSARTIPALEQRYRKLVVSAVVGAPRVLLRPTRLTVPPKAAFFLLDLLLTKADRGVIPGDLDEDFGSDLSKYGAGYARFLFWSRTLGAIAWRNPVCRWALVSGLARLGNWLLRNLG
jgi:hypothetical protein